MSSNLENEASKVEEIEKSTQQPETQELKIAWDFDDIHQAALADNPEHAERPSLTTVLSIMFIGMSTVAPLGCGFIVATSILYEVGSALGDTTNIGWVVSGWSIASSVSFSLAGSLSDIFGRRNVILAGEFFSLVGAIIAATAESLPALIGGSTILGFSCGFILVAYAAVPELLPNKWRAVGISSVEGFLTIPWVALAFLLGNLFYLRASWRWVYYVCIIYAAVSFTGTASMYFPPPRPASDLGKTRLQQLAGLDFLGIALYASGLSAVLLGLSWAGTVGHAWSSTSVVAPIILGGIAFIASFVRGFTYLHKRNRHALFPRDLLLQFREFTTSLIVIFASGSVYYTMSAFLPQATRVVYTAKPLELGVLLLPNGLGQFVGTAVIPAFISATGRPKIYLIIGVFAQTLFTGLYAYAIGGHKAAWAAFQFFGAGPFGLVVVTTVLNAGLHVRPSELGIAVGVLGTFRSMGGSVGNAIHGSILRSVSNEELPKQIIANALEKGFTGDLTMLIPAAIRASNGVSYAFAHVTGINADIEAAVLAGVRQAWIKAFRMVFYSTIPFGVIALIAALFIKDSTKYMTNHTHIRLEKDVLQRRERAGEESRGNHTV